MADREGTIVTYQAPAGAPQNDDYMVQVRFLGESQWQTLFTHDAVVANLLIDQTNQLEHMSFAYFDSDFARPLEVMVTSNSVRIERACIRPRNTGIQYTHTDRKIHFQLCEPQKISIEVNNDLYHNLFLFAQPLEDEQPVETGSADTLFYGPGIHDVGHVELSSGQTVYIHGGAVVYGCFLCNGADHVTIKGRGILDGSRLDHRMTSNRMKMIEFRHCSHMAINDIIIRDSPEWTIMPFECSHVVIRNIKQITYNGNSDGLDICSCSDVLIEDVFLRNWDDNISIKSFSDGNRDITMRKSVLWSDKAHNMLIGPEANPKKSNIFERIYFEDIDVLEDKEYNEIYMGVMALMCADNAVFRDISWHNIRVDEMSYGNLISLQFVCVYATTFGSQIYGIHFSDISYSGKLIHRSKIHGHDEARNIKDIEICNLKINGRTQTSIENVFDVNDFASDIRLTQTDPDQ